MLYETFRGELLKKLVQRISERAYAVTIRARGIYVPEPSSPEGQGNLSEMEAVVALHPKDLSLLPYVISGIRFSINANLRIVICLPRASVETAKKFLFNWNSLLAKNLDFLAEEDVLPKDRLRRIYSFYGKRGDWVYQQLLKLQLVITSGASCNILVDADTVLTRQRNWFPDPKQHLLMPTFEFKGSYYRFLSSLGVGKRLPKFSFVAHHMVMKRAILEEVLGFLSIDRVEEFDSLIASMFTQLDRQSPVSLDFELYAQYLFSRYRDSIHLERWENVSMSREKYFGAQPKGLAELAPDAFSVSLHDYL